MRQDFLDLAHSRRPPEQGVEGWNLAELLVPEQRKFFIRCQFRRLALAGQAFLDEPGLGVALVENRACGKSRERDYDEHEERD